MATGERGDNDGKSDNGSNNKIICKKITLTVMSIDDNDIDDFQCRKK